MTTAKRRPRSRFAKGPPRPQYLQGADIDKVVMMLMALAADVSALRDRIDTHEALGDAGKQLSTDAVESFALPPERQAQREQQREAMLRRILRVVTEELESAQQEVR
jgi:hypothetical protein